MKRNKILLDIMVSGCALWVMTGSSVSARTSEDSIDPFAGTSMVKNVNLEGYSEDDLRSIATNAANNGNDAVLIAAFNALAALKKPSVEEKSSGEEKPQASIQQPSTSEDPNKGSGNTDPKTFTSSKSDDEIKAAQGQQVGSGPEAKEDPVDSDGDKKSEESAGSEKPAGDGAASSSSSSSVVNPVDSDAEKKSSDGDKKLEESAGSEKPAGSGSSSLTSGSPESVVSPRDVVDPLKGINLSAEDLNGMYTAPYTGLKQAMNDNDSEKYKKELDGAVASLMKAYDPKVFKAAMIALGFKPDDEFAKNPHLLAAYLIKLGKTNFGVDYDKTHFGNLQTMAEKMEKDYYVELSKMILFIVGSEESIIKSIEDESLDKTKEDESFAKAKEIVKAEIAKVAPAAE